MTEGDFRAYVVELAKCTPEELDEEYRELAQIQNDTAVKANLVGVLRSTYDQTSEPA